MTSAAPMLCIPVGAVLCGALVDHAAAPRRLTFTMVLGFLLIAVVLIVVSRVAVTRTTVRQALTSLGPQVRVLAGAGRALLAMAGLILAAWSMSGFYQAFGPSIVPQQLGSHASLTAGAVFGSFTVLALIGGPLTARLRPDRALRLGAIAYAVCVAGILATLCAAAIESFPAVSLLAGVAQTGGVGTLLARTEPNRRTRPAC